MLEFLSICALLPWQYPYHLGIFGIYRLFEAISKDQAGVPRPNRLFIIGELPEELTTYRDKVAQWLNATDRADKKGVRAFTGDIGLHVSLSTIDHGRIQPKLRCTYCNYNNELVCKHDNYHTPDKMGETPITRLHAAMIYLCKEKDHQPDKGRCFLSRPEIRVV